MEIIEQRPHEIRLEAMKAKAKKDALRNQYDILKADVRRQTEELEGVMLSQDITIRTPERISRREGRIDVAQANLRQFIEKFGEQ